MNQADPLNTASWLSAKGQAALADGDTTSAQKWFKEAGEVLEKEIGRHRNSAKVVKFYDLAATQYFKGGHYDKANELCQKITFDTSLSWYWKIIAKFAVDLQERLSPDYHRIIRDRLKSTWEEKNWSKIVALLQEHPYVLQPHEMALLRGYCCDQIGDTAAAKLFYADAVARLFQ